MKTSKLIDSTLDWAVAETNGMFSFGVYTGSRVINDKLHLLNSNGDVFNSPYQPSKNWAQGGPIIEREKIKVDPRKGNWEATIWNEPQIRNPSYGPTHLIAAMRCYVASKLGDEVDVPEELKCVAVER